MLVDAISAQVLGQRSLDTLVKRRKVWTTILLSVSLEAVHCRVALDIVTHLHIVVVNLSVNARGLNDHALLSRSISNQDCEVDVVLRLSTLLVVFILLVLILRIVRQWLSERKNNGMLVFSCESQFSTTVVNL